MRGTRTEVAGTTTVAGAPGDSTATAAGALGGGATGAASADSLDPERTKPEDRPRAAMRVEVDVRARQLRVFGDTAGGQVVATYPVGVGTSEWPTKPGRWLISQVVFNPEFIPPDQSWAEERERKAPGAPDNPLGEAQLIYDPPRTIHGTNKPESVGKAQSHGSIRMRNAEVVALAREVMRAAGVEKDEAWFQQVRQNRTEKQIVNLPRVVPIVVH